MIFGHRNESNNLFGHRHETMNQFGHRKPMHTHFIQNILNEYEKHKKEEIKKRSPLEKR